MLKYNLQTCSKYPRSKFALRFQFLDNQAPFALYILANTVSSSLGFAFVCSRIFLSIFSNLNTYVKLEMAFSFLV